MSIYESSITNPKKQLEFYKDLSEQLQQEKQQLKTTNESLTSLVNSCQEKIRDLQAIEKEHQKINGELRENYEAILRQRDDITKNATETIEKYQQKNQQLKDAIDEAKNKLNEDIQDLNNFSNGLIQPSELIKSLKLYLQILDKAKVEDERPN